MKVLILGHARHGKDTFAELLGLRFESSSKSALGIFLFDKLNNEREVLGLPAYQSRKEAFEDRVNCRSVWFDEIKEYNKDDKARLAKGILRRSDCYVGMRSNDEYWACVKAGLFDLVFWVDASHRKAVEDDSSFDIDFDPSHMIWVDNNLGLDFLKGTAERYRNHILAEAA